MRRRGILLPPTSVISRTEERKGRKSFFGGGGTFSPPLPKKGKKGRSYCLQSCLSRKAEEEDVQLRIFLLYLWPAREKIPPEKGVLLPIIHALRAHSTSPFSPEYVRISQKSLGPHHSSSFCPPPPVRAAHPSVAARRRSAAAAAAAAAGSGAAAAAAPVCQLFITLVAPHYYTWRILPVLGCNEGGRGFYNPIWEPNTTKEESEGDPGGPTTDLRPSGFPRPVSLSLMSSPLFSANRVSLSLSAVSFSDWIGQQDFFGHCKWAPLLS